MKEKNIRAKGRKRERTKTSHEMRSQLFHSSSRGTIMVIVVVVLAITRAKHPTHIEKDKVIRVHFKIQCVLSILLLSPLTCLTEQTIDCSVMCFKLPFLHYLRILCNMAKLSFFFIDNLFYTYRSEDREFGISRFSITS